MAATTMDLINYGTSFRFLVSVDELNKNCTETAETVLSNVPWKARVCRVLDGTSRLYVYVVANIVDSTWLIEARCEYRLFIKGGPKYNSGTTIWLQFNSSSPSNEISMPYTNKSMLSMEDYAIEGNLHFEVLIDTRPLQIIEKKQFENFGSKFRVVLKNVNQLNSSFYHASSQEVTIRGIRWQILAYQEKKYFMVHLRGNRDHLGLDWSTNVTANIELLPFDTRKPYIPERYATIEQAFSLETNDHGIRFSKWKNLNDPESIYVLNDSVALLIDIVVGPKEYFWKEIY